MTPVPAPRDGTESGSAVPAIVIDIFREGLAEVKDAVKEVNASVIQLRGETVSRHDYDRFMDNFRIDWAAAQQRHDADIARVTAAVAKEREDREERERQDADARRVREDQEKRDRRTDWRWRWGLTGGFITAITAAVVGHIPFH